MENPRFEIDLSKIRHNAGRIIGICQPKGISVVGVTKAVCAHPALARALIEAGITKLADSRMQNIIKLREAGFTGEIALLRIPMLSENMEAVRYTDISYQSEFKVIEEFNRIAQFLDKIHRVILMVEVGDLREGILPGDLDALVRRILKLTNIKLIGLAMNVGCYGGVLPSLENTSLLVKLREELQKKYDIVLPVVSGGSSSTVMMLEKGGVAPGVNEVRVGEAIFLGTGGSSGGIITACYTDAFKLISEVIEIREKPSVPSGVIEKDAFGKKPAYVDKGIRKRAILAIGRQDAPPDGLIPLGQGIEIIGASSDHLILDVTDYEKDLRVGDEVAFIPNYGGLISLMASAYVKKIISCW